MKLEDQVVNLELSKKLKELGVKQESLWYWVRTHDCYGDGKDDYELCMTFQKEAWVESDMGKEFYSTFTCAELGEMIPHFMSWRNKNEYVISVHAGIGKLKIRAKTEADCRAKMLIYLKEHK